MFLSGFRVLSSCLFVLCSLHCFTYLARVHGVLAHVMGQDDSDGYGSVSYGPQPLQPQFQPQSPQLNAVGGGITASVDEPKPSPVKAFMHHTDAVVC
jgi:hypothetical protein